MYRIIIDQDINVEIEGVILQGKSGDEYDIPYDKFSLVTRHLNETAIKYRMDFKLNDSNTFMLESKRPTRKAFRK